MSDSGWFATRVPWSRKAFCWVSRNEFIHLRPKHLPAVQVKKISTTCTSGKGFGKPKDKKAGKAAKNPAKHAQSSKRGKPSSSKAFGPRGMLLVGFTEDDFEAVTSWFSAIEPGFRISCCSDELLGLPLEGAVTAPDGSFRPCQGWQKPRELVPRAALFSGLSEEEAMGIAHFWESSGKPLQLPHTRFAAVLLLSRTSLRKVEVQGQGQALAARDAFKQVIPSACWTLGAESVECPPSRLTLYPAHDHVDSWWSAGIKAPIFASAVEAAKAKPLRAVLLEVAQAYAASITPPEETLNAESLRALLRERMAAKSGEPPGDALRRGPIVINTDGSSSS